jgi:hypothetical protein
VICLEQRNRIDRLGLIGPIAALKSSLSRNGHN